MRGTERGPVTAAAADPEQGEGPVLRGTPQAHGRGPAHSPRGGLPAEAQQEQAEAADPGGGHGGPGPAG